MADARSSTGNVHVAVVVRPLSHTEWERGCKNVIQVEDDGRVNVTCTSSSGAEDVKTFKYNHAHGPSDDPERPVQQLVFEDMGPHVVADALLGYNVCLFAYGQCGAGKTHTMIGSVEAPGLILRIGRHLLDRARETGLNFTLEASYLELYNDKVHDLLDMDQAKDKLRVREHPQRGPFVEGLTVHDANSFDSLVHLIFRGEAARTVAPLDLNPASNRGHAIFTLVLRQFAVNAGVLCTTTSVINLVDLAGIERISATDALNELRVKEGGSTNKSLVFFGKCLTSLADRGKLKGKKGGDHVPYRDSNLTWLLKESLGGNAKTYMVGVVSPADTNVGESLSTLHYADRAKKIVTLPVVNVIRNTQQLLDLENEVKRLERALELAKSLSGRSFAPSVETSTQTRRPQLSCVTQAGEDLPAQSDVVEERDEARATAAALASQLEALQAQFASSEAARSSAEALAQHREHAMRELSQRIEALEHELAAQHDAAVRSQEREAAEREALAKKLTALQSVNDDLQQQLKALQQEMHDRREQHASESDALNRALCTEQNRLAQAQAAHAELTSRLEAEIASRHGDVATLQAQTELQVTHLREQLRLMEAQLKLQDEQATRDAARLQAALTRQQGALTSAQNTFEQTLQSKDIQLAGFEEMLKQKAAELARAQQEVADLRDKWKRELEFFRSKFLSKWESSASSCQNCSVTFTMVTARRHHCRICGHAFCGSCCAERVQTSAARRPVRACAECSAFLNMVEQDLASLEEAVTMAKQASGLATDTFVAYDS